MVAAALVSLLAGCDDFPKDIDGTMQHVTAEGLLLAGVVAEGPVQADEEALAQSVAEAAGVDVQIETGSAEKLLRELEEGELDLVVGEFAKASPWTGRVAFTASPASGSPPKKEPVLRAAVRPGENRWLMFVSKTLRKEERGAAGSG